MLKILECLLLKKKFLKKGAPGDQVRDLLCMQLASYLERGQRMWMMPLTCTLIKNLIMIDDEIIKDSFLINYQKKYALLPTCISKQNGPLDNEFLYFYSGWVYHQHVFLRL